MKKITIVMAMVLATTLLNSCGSGEKIVGSNAAKLLVANERLDSTSLKNVNINFDYSSNKKKSRRLSSLKVEPVKARRNNEINVKRANEHETGVKAKREGNLITWTNFEEYSNAISYFNSFIKSINTQAKEAAKVIDNAKDRIESNNVWVKSLFNDMLLQVSENKDVVIRRTNDYYQIVTRSLNEQGVEYYDVFNSDVGDVYGARVRKLGDYRYEYSYITEDNEFSHFFIADKSRGYWIVQSPVNGHQFSMTIIKDDKCYDFTTHIDTKDIGMIKIITSDTKCDIGSFHYDTFSFYPGAFKNIESLSMEVSEDKLLKLDNYDTSGYDNYDVLYCTLDKAYVTLGNNSCDINLTNGKKLKVNDQFANGKVKLISTYVSGNADGMLPEFSLDVQGATYEEKIANLKLFIQETGLEFIRSNEEIFSSIEVACKDAKASLNSISWNDINLDSIESYAQAIEIERNKLPAFSSIYNEVKDNTVLSRYQQGTLDRKTTFPYIINSSFNANYESNIVTINNAEVKVDDFTLFDNDSEYNMQFALAQYNEENEGYFDLLPLDVENPNYATYNGQEQLSITTNNLSFALPVPSVGTYELVTYVANKEGIRVTRPQPVKFNTVETSQISIHNYTADVVKTEEGLLGIESKINENIVLEIKEQKESYSYSELYRLLSTEAYNYGIPSTDEIEMIDNSSNWVKLNSSSSNLSSGTYRLAFKNQSDKLVYVYTTLK